MPREGHDSMPSGTVRPSKIFQSTCPARGTTAFALQRLKFFYSFQSTCPARGTTDTYHDNYLRFGLSIHVPREGHDLHDRASARRVHELSIHVPREGHDNNRYQW